MAVTIGSLVIRLTATTGLLQKGLNKGARVLKGFGTAALGVAKKIFSLGASIVALAGVAGVLLLVRSGLKLVDSLAKTADQLSITTEELAGFRLAAQIGGASTEVLDKSLAKMLKTIGDAEVGLSTATQAFSDLGLSSENLAKLPTADAFKLIADRIAGVEDPSKKTRIAMDIFGRSGVKLINTLNAGSESLEAFTEEAKLLGLGIDRVDAAKVEAAVDAITRVKAVIQGLATRLAIEFAPLITTIGERLATFAKSGEGVGAKVSKAFKFIILTGAKVVDLFRFMQIGVATFKVAALDALTGIAKFASGVIKALETVINKIPGVSIQVGKLSDALSEGLAQTTREAGLELARLTEQDLPSAKVKKFLADIGKEAEINAQKIAKNAMALVEAGKATEGFSDKARITINALRDQVDAFGLDSKQLAIFKLRTKGASEEQINLAKSLLDQLGSLQQAKDLQDEANKITEAAASPAERYSKKIAQLTTLLDRELITIVTFNRAVAETEDQLKSAAEAKVDFERKGPAAFESRFLVSAGRRATDPAVRTQKVSEKIAQATIRVLEEEKKQTRALERVTASGLKIVFKDIG